MSAEAGWTEAGSGVPGFYGELAIFLKNIFTTCIATNHLFKDGNGPSYTLIFLYQMLLQKWFILPAVASPHVDGDFLPDHPARLMRDGEFNQVDLMAGFTREDGSFITNRK